MTTLKNVRVLKDIPELVVQLRAIKARCKDYLIESKLIKMVTEAEPDKDSSGVLLKIERKEGSLAFDPLDQAHGQIAGKTEVPMGYYRRMMEDGMLGRNLLADNVNHWLAKEPQKKRLIRCIDLRVRGFLGGRYRPVDDLDVVTVAVQTVTGQIREGAGEAEGARCFAHSLDEKKMRVAFVNPRLGVNLSKIDEGLHRFGPEDMNADGFFRDMRSPGAGWVFPTARIDNSETGHGGLGVADGLFEGYCANGSFFEKAINMIHVGKELTEDELWSPDTMRKVNQVIFAKVRDLFKKAFNPESFLQTCRKFKGLEFIEINPIQAADAIVALHGMTEDVRDEILAAYHSQTLARKNLFDFQRGVTAAAHTYREVKPEIAEKLEAIGGDIISREEKALAKV